MDRWVCEQCGWIGDQPAKAYDDNYYGYNCCPKGCTNEHDEPYPIEFIVGLSDNIKEGLL